MKAVADSRFIRGRAETRTSISSAMSLTSSSVYATPTRLRYATRLSEWHAAHTCWYTWCPRRMLAWSYESNMPSCGHGYCALCRPCSASSASATPATPSSAKLLNPIAANPWLGAQCAPVGSALAAAGRAAAAAAARAARDSW